MIRSLFTTVLIACFGLAAVPMAAQTLTIYNVDASGFPRVSADYVYFDSNGQPQTGFNATDFSVVERHTDNSTVDLSATLTHECVTIDPEASIILVLDRSNSMRDEVNGKPRFRYAQDALISFVNRVNFIGETRVCLVTFAGNYEVKVDWTANRDEIIDTINKLEPLTSTDYRLPFESPNNNIYEKFRERPVNIPKYTFFLTDGYPNPAIPDEVKFAENNIDSLLKQAIRFFAVTILQPNTHPVLTAMADGTGGKAIVTNEAGLVDLFALLALETQIKEACRLTWIAPYACSEGDRNRSATITLKKFNNPQANVSYFVPDQGVASVDISEPVLFCGDPAVGGSSFANVTITARNAPLNVTAFSITPNTFFSVVDWNFPTAQTNFAPFTLARNATRTLRVRFQQGGQQIFRQANLEMSGTPCPPKITLVGGTGLAILSSPNGGELFSTCDSVTITWAGVLPTQPVKLEYSTDGGATWTVITTSATGFKYKWLPPQAGTQYKVKVSVEPTDQYQWAAGIGGTGTETATSVAVSSDNVRIYTTGNFDGPFKAGTTTANNAVGNMDGYLIEWTADGNITKTTLLVGSGNSVEHMTGVVTDESGNYYVAGDFASPSAMFGTQNMSKPGGDVSDCFLFKYNATGSLQWANYARGDGLNNCTAECTNIGVQVAGGVTRVMLVGRFKRFVRVGLRPNGSFEQSATFNDTRWRNFWVVYDEAGNAIQAAYDAIPPAGWTLKSFTADDDNGFTYTTGDYTGSKTFAPPTITIPGFGGQDVFLSKFGAIPASSDESDNVFTVASPQITFNQTSVTMDPIAVGQTSSKSVTGVLCNTGNFPVVISQVRFTGANNADFTLTGNLNGVRLKPGECTSIELLFAPSAVGTRRATLEISETCGSTATLALDGVGLPPCAWEVQASVNLGNLPKGQSQSYPVTCVLRNTGPAAISGTLTAQGSADLVVAPLGAFTLQPNQCLDVTVNVNANTPGVQAVTLDFGLPAECGGPTSAISILVVEPDVRISSVDFGRHRLGTIANDVIEIENRNTDPVRITDVQLSNASDPNLQLVLPTPVPFDLAPSEKRTIPVTFSPQTRGLHVVTVTATVLGQADPLVGEARGVGFLPAIDATGYDFQAWTVGLTSSEIGKVTITNTDTDAALFVKSVAFAGPTTDFAWATGAPSDVTIPAGGSIEVDVTFTPQAAGTRSIQVCIEHDAIPGDVPPYTTTCVNVTGIGAEPSDIQPVNMGSVLTCVSKTATVRIVNPNASFPLNCDAPVGSGDVSEITISETAPFTIPPGQSRDVIVTFTPSGVGPFAASYAIPNDQGLALNVNVSGTGITTPADFRFNNIVSGIIGQAAVMPVTVTTGDLTGVTMGTVTLVFSYSSEFVAFKELTTPQQAGWTFQTDATVPGQLTVIGTPDVGATLTNGAFVTPSFNVYLTSEDRLPVTFTAQADPTCIVATGDNTGEIAVEQVCYAEGRLIKLGAAPFTIGHAKPNPAADHTTFAYSTGIAVATVFEVVDAMGNVVRTISTPVLPSGVYELNLETGDLASGLYVVRMVSGPFVESRTISVIR